MQSKRKEMKMELVSCERRLQKLYNYNYNENLYAVALENKNIKFDKPIYIGKYNFLNFTFIMHLLTYLLFTRFAVLDISKTMMYDYHCNVIQRHNKDKVKLMYTDTGK